jgi:hypothetical protein
LPQWLVWSGLFELSKKEKKRKEIDPPLGLKRRHTILEGQRIRETLGDPESKLYACVCVHISIGMLKEAHGCHFLDEPLPPWPEFFLKKFKN